MALNDAFLAKMEREIEAAKEASNVAAHAQDKVLETVPDVVEQVAQPIQDTTISELEALKKEIAELKSAKVEAPSSEPTQQAQTDAVDFYENPEERQYLVEQWGEDEVIMREKMIARAFQAAQKVTQPKISELEKRNQQLEKTQQSAEFTRAVGSEALKVFNDATFQAVAKGTETGFKRTLYDDLKAIVEGSDVEGAEYLRSQIEKYNTGTTAVRKAQVTSGRSPVASAQEKPAYDQNKADKLMTEMQRHRVGTDAFTNAKEKLDKYLSLAA